LTFDGISFTADSAYMTIITDTIVNIGPGGVVANLNLWITANAGTSSSTNGAAVATWINQAPLGDSLTAAATQQPLFRDGTTTSAFNYNPSLDFDGVNDFYAGTSNYGVTGTSPFTAFAIGRRASQANIDMLWGQNTAGAPTGSASFFKNTTPFQTAIDGAAGIGSKFGTATHSTNIPFLIGLNRSAATTFQLYNAGTLDGTASNLPNSFSGNILTSNLNIGKRIDHEFDGDIAEQVIYGQSLSGTDMQKVNSYLALKYGITMNQGASGLDYLASNGTVIWTGNSTYRFNIAGIGLDSCSALNQKQSHSEDTFQRGEIVAIGKGTIATDNASNGVLFDANRDFLVWGADSARGFKNTEFPASITSQACVSVSRLQKEWKTQVTGTSSQTTQVKFFLSGLIPSSTSILDLKLLVDTVDAVFDNGGTRIIDAAAYNETTQEVTFDNVVFKNNNYFTLLIDVYAIAPGGVTSGIQAWLRADKGITVATGVSKWADQSTNNREAAQATVANQPTYNMTSSLMNFNQNASFDGGDLMTFSNTLGMTGDVEVNFFTVISPAANNNNMRIVLGETAYGGGSYSVGIWGSNGGVLDRSSVTIGSNDSFYPAGSINILGFRKNTGNTTADLIGYHNGKLTKNNDAPSAWSLNSANKVLGAASSAGASAFVGRMGDVAVYVGALTYVERNRIESYMALKYGITLDQSGSGMSYRASYGAIVWDSTVNTSYKRRIFGIGRDFCSGLYQKQSTSSHAGSILTVSLNTMATSNAVNTGALAKDSMFTIIGDNDSTLTQQSSDLPTTISSCGSRLKREWKAQVTGDAVEAEYRFDVTSVTGKGTNLTDYRIIIDEDGNGDFTNGTVRIFDASSFASNIVTFSDLKINNGEVFTLVTKGATVGQVALTTSSTKVTSLSDGCSVNGWTYYTDPVDTTKLVIAIFNNGNTVNVDSITINTGSGFTDADLSKGRKTPDERAVSIMKRLIQVSAPGTFAVNGGVKVRLYYAQSEVDDVTTRMNQLKTDSNIVGTSLPFTWFKTKKTIPQIISTMTSYGVDPGRPDSTRVTWSAAGDSSGIENGVKFIQLHGIKTFSTFGGGVSVANSNPLPVELLDFTGEKKEDASHLRWQTASEKNVDRFEIERSTQPSANDWEKLGEVKAVGNSRFIQDYSFVDLYPERAMNYYRLKIIDNDAIVDYSKVIALDYRKLGLSNITVYPNPVSESFFIDAKGHDKETISLKLYDASRSCSLVREL
jgi:hypothetical protein